MSGLPSVPWYERLLALLVFTGILVLPWFYIGVGIYVAVDRPGFTPFVAFAFGSAMGVVIAVCFVRLWQLTFHNEE